MPEQVAQKLYEIEKRALEPDDVMFRVLAAVYQNDGGVGLIRFTFNSRARSLAPRIRICIVGLVALTQGG
jgi:hypothetical protein